MCAPARARCRCCLTLLRGTDAIAYKSLWRHCGAYVSSDHRISSASNGIRLRPRSVSEYSTRGGISAYSRRDMSRSLSSFFRVSVSTLGDMSGMALPISLNRVDSFSASTHRMSIDHLPVNRDSMLRMGQEAMPVYFFRFSLSGKLFIFKNSYFRVSD